MLLYGIPAVVGGELSRVVGYKGHLCGFHFQHQLHKLVFPGVALNVELGGDDAGDLAHIAVADMAFVWAGMYGDAIGAKPLTIYGCLQHIGATAAAAVAQCGYLIDIDRELRLHGHKSKTLFAHHRRGRRGLLVAAEQTREERALFGDGRNLQHAYVFVGAVGSVAGLCSYLVHNVHTFYHLAEDGVVAIEEGGATLSFVHLTLFGGELAAVAAGYVVKLGIGEFLARNEVELCCRPCLGGVAVAGHTHSAALVVDGIIDLGRNCIGEATATQMRARCSAFGIGVAALYHELWYTTVKQQAIIDVLFGVFHHVVGIERGVVVEHQYNVAVLGLYFYLVLLRK